MNRTSAVLVAVLLLLPAGQTRGQTSDTSTFLEQAGALQSKLPHWRQTLNKMNFSQLPSGSTQAQRNLLERQRSICLTWIDTLDREIAAVQSKPTLAGEVRLVLDGRRFAATVFALHDSLNTLVSFRQRFGDITAYRDWMALESKMDSMGPSFDEGRLMRQLDAIGGSAKPVAAKPQLPGQISGHVYRAGTGKPLAGVRVMLELATSFGHPLRLVETSADGRYTFSNVPPGQYRVGAYLKGFTRGEYMLKKDTGLGGTVINLASGQKAGGIDMRLHPLVSVTQMDEKALVAELGIERLWLRFGPGRFSPDRRLFGLVVNSNPKQVWVYNLKSRLLTRVVGRPPGGFGGTTIAWVGGTLYTEYTGGAGADQYLAWTPKGIRPIPQLPAAAKADLDQASAQQSGAVGTGRFTVSAVPPTCYHCTGLNLIARPVGGGKPFMIARGSWELGSFAVENHGSLVLFPRFTYPALALFDLNTRRAREDYLPVRAQRFLDATPEPGGFLVAYTSYGPCQGYGGQGGVRGLYPQRAPYNVCFANIPYGGKK